MVDLPGVNTPQFDRAMNKMGRKAQPVPPIYQPEVPARAICFAAAAVAGVALVHQVAKKLDF